MDANAKQLTTPLDPIENEALPDIEEALLKDRNILDPGTGEVLDTIPDELDLKWAEQATQRLALVQAEMHGIGEARRIALAAVEANFAPAFNAAARKAQWLETVYTDALRDLAKENLPKDKRTLTLPFAKLMFRTVKGAFEVLEDDTEKLAMYLHSKGAGDAVKMTTSILKSNIPEEVRADMITDQLGILHEDRETFKIEAIKA